MKLDTAAQTLVFYDGACAACTAEMQIRRGWDCAQRLNMIDIAAADFDAHAWPVSAADMHSLLHVRLPDGTWLNAMAATRHLYRVVGRGWMLAFTGWPLLAGLFDRAYAWFARHRLPISSLLGPRRCTDGTCCNDHRATPALRISLPHPARGAHRPGVTEHIFK